MNATAEQTLAAFRSGRTTPLPNRRFDKPASRDADKFVVRMPDGMRSEVEVAAEDRFISMNAFILQAIAEKLDRESRQDLLLDTLAKAVQPETTQLITVIRSVRKVFEDQADVREYIDSLLNELPNANQLGYL